MMRWWSGLGFGCVLLLCSVLHIASACEREGQNYQAGDFVGDEVCLPSGEWVKRDSPNKVKGGDAPAHQTDDEDDLMASRTGEK